MPIRIYALARQLNLDSELLIDICAQAGVMGKGSAIASLSDEEIEQVKAFLASSSGTKAVAKPRADTPFLKPIHREWNINKEVAFERMEAALLRLLQEHFSEGDDISIRVDRETGAITGEHNGVPLTSKDISELILARTATAQTAIQGTIQRIRDILDGVIEIKTLAWEPGSCMKIAVCSEDPRIDSMGDVENHIKNTLDEITNERIDIVPYSDDMRVFIRNALQPAEVEEVILCRMLGKAIVLVREDQLSLAIGRRGLNVRLASKLCVWDIEIMTGEELDDELEEALTGFSSLEGMNEELAERLVVEGFLSYDDLSVIEPDALAEMGGLEPAQVIAVIEQAERKAAEAEALAQEERRRQREEDRRKAADREQAEAGGPCGSSDENSTSDDSDTSQNGSEHDPDDTDAGGQNGSV